MLFDCGPIADMAWLLGPVKGLYFKLYMIMDIFSRFIVGWEIHEEELTKHAERLITKTRFKHGTLIDLIVLHSDNAGIFKAQTFQALLENLGIIPSYSRSRVSNDNAFSEALFKTVKHVNTYPDSGFTTIEEARAWVKKFVYLYNTHFLHSGIKYVTPYQRHYGLDKEILLKRDAVYQAVRAVHPERWTGNTRDWSWIDKVTLNPVTELITNKQKRQLS